MSKITIIGAGQVGATIAYTLAVTGATSEIVMIDINREKAIGVAMDIYQGTPFCHPCLIYEGSYADAVGSDIVILTSGLPRKAGQSRLELAQVNTDITKQIIPQIVRYAPEAHYIIVSNPVDILTYVFTKVSGLPESHIIGSGTVLDTSRLRVRLSECCSINQQNIHAYVLGEHGDSSFIPWSVASISNIPLDDWNKLMVNPATHYPELDHEEIENYVRTSGGRIIAAKGATFNAVSVTVCYIVKALLSSIDTTMTVSTMLNGEYGIDDVCMSILNVVNNQGAHSKLLLPLTDRELKQLHHSAECLKNVIKSIKI